MYLRGQSRSLAGVTEDRSEKRVLLDAAAASSSVAERHLVSRAVDLAKLVRMGAATCGDLRTYNDVALRHYRLNVGFYEAVLAAGANPRKVARPWMPPLFTTQVNEPMECAIEGRSCGRVSIADPCSGGAIDPRMSIWNDQIDLIRLFEDLQPTGGSGYRSVGFVLPVVVAWGIGALLAGGAAALTGWAVSEVIDSLQGAQLKKLDNEYNQLTIEIGSEAMRVLLECTEKLVGQGVDPLVANERCSKDVAAAFPDAKIPSNEGGLLSGVGGAMLKIGAAGAVLYGGYRLITERQG